MTAAERTLRVIIADDQTAVREGLATLLDLVAGIDVIAVARDGREALALALRESPDAVLMDLQMPVMDGVEATRRIRAARPHVEVVVLTTHADDSSILEALNAGARGFLTKDSGRNEIALALRAASNGQTILDPRAHERLLAAAGAPHTTTRELPDGLTTREAQVLELIAGGLTNGQIAARLVVSEATIKTHVNHIFAKTGARDRAQAVHYAYRHGLEPQA
jgi:DNA-binding NarL/FixJ family response regulator